MSEESITIRQLFGDDFLDSKLKDQAQRVWFYLSNKEVDLSPSRLLAFNLSSDTRVYGAFLGEDLVGLACLTLCLLPLKFQGIVNDVAVIPARGRRGVGTKLMVHLIDEARKAGCDCLQLTSRPEREAANNLYLKVGFRPRATNPYKLTFNVADPKQQ
jgi:ribosomal protein S18 acetylase RimI-like enzyme